MVVRSGFCFTSLRIITRNMGKEKKPSQVSSSKTEIKEEEKAVSINKSGQIVLRIHAKPGSKISQVTDVGVSEVGVSIGAPPREGQANEELLSHIQQVLGLKKSEIEFEKGAKSRSKILLITSSKVTLDSVVQKLKEDAGQT